MIVVDASAFVELLSNDRGLHEQVVNELRRDSHWVVAEHCVLEAMNALRGLRRSGRHSEEDFQHFVDGLVALELDIWPTAPLLPRVRELVDNATAYDAAHIALAEELGIPLITLDTKLRGVPKVHCAIVTIA